ncbi:Intraflagellar transport protein 57 [Chionoecetes opilio]|uniref:Large ribosomal subunit protein eL24 n=1 Tax=Chionoecetes opilio TaxID=41210 RepID=A0A8J5D1W0_CHIOP|nr:Intraflagellar transport protein 57 [Chionoecetes opilio]
MCLQVTQAVHRVQHVSTGDTGCSQGTACVYRLQLCNFSGYKIQPGHGKTMVRTDGKVYVFMSAKCERAHMMKRNPREIRWTILYRQVRKHKKGMEEETTKKRTRRTQKYQRAIVGASLIDIMTKRNMKPEVRKAQREQAIRAAKEKNRAAKASKKANAPAPAKTLLCHRHQPRGAVLPVHLAGGPPGLTPRQAPIGHREEPTYPVDDSGGDEGEVEDESELTLDKVEEDMMAEYQEEEEEEEENILHMDDLKHLNKQKGGEAWPEEILHSTTTQEEWKLELERVLPQLKVTIRSDTRDWRSHIEQMHEHRQKINETLTFTDKQLDGLHSEISRSLEKIGSREKYLNGQLEPLLLEYRNLQNVAAESREQYRQASGKLVEKSHELAQISDELDRVKHEMEERGSSMTDGTPLVNVRKALTRVRQEITAMDVRIGVVEQKLLQAKLQDKTNLQRDMNAPVYNNMDMGLF